MVAQRGERLELLIDKTENLVDSVSIEYDISFQGFKTTALISEIYGNALNFMLRCFVSLFPFSYLLYNYIVIKRVTVRHTKQSLSRHQ